MNPLFTRFAKAVPRPVLWIGGAVAFCVWVLVLLWHFGAIRWPERTGRLTEIKAEQGAASACRYPSAPPGFAIVPRSAVLTENGQMLKPAKHESVVRGGERGTFFPRSSRILFASGDGSDPRTNERVYAITCRMEMSRGLRAIILLSGAACVALALWWVLVHFRSSGVRLIGSAHDASADGDWLPEAERFRGVWAWLIFGLALAIRWHFLWANPHVNDGMFLVQGAPFSDACQWHRMAAAVAGGHGVDTAFPGKRPFYAIFLALFYTWTGSSLEVARQVHVVASAFSAVLIFLIFRRLSGLWVALAAALFFAFDPQQTQQVVETMTEQVGTFLLILSVWLLAVPARRLAFWPLFAAGMAFALSNLARPLTLFGFPLYTLLIAGLAWTSGRRRWDALALPVAAFAAGAALCIGPWVVRQHAMYGLWSLSDNTASGLYAASTPKYGYWRGDIETLPIKAGVPYTTRDRYQFFQQGFRENLQKYPGFYLKNILRCLLPAATYGKVLDWPLISAAALACAAVAIVAARRRRWLPVLAAALAALLLALAMSRNALWVMLIGAGFSLWRRPYPAAVLLVSFFSAVLGSSLFGNPVLFRLRYLIDWMAAGWLLIAVIEVAGLALSVLFGLEWRQWFARSEDRFAAVRTPRLLRWAGWTAAAFLLVSSGRLVALNVFYPPQPPAKKMLAESEQRLLLAGLARRVPEWQPLTVAATLPPARPHEPRLFTGLLWFDGFSYFLPAGFDPKHFCHNFAPRPYTHSIVGAFSAALPFRPPYLMVSFPGEFPRTFFGGRCIVVGFSQEPGPEESGVYTMVDLLAILPGEEVTPAAIEQAVIAPLVPETREGLRLLEAAAK